MNKVIAATLGIIAIIGTAFGVQEYLDNRYILKDEAEATLATLPTGAIIAWYGGNTDKLLSKRTLSH
ncbi:MAG: hypothetical protein OXG03_05775 [Gammaproteobacteria bacterium]|nr:hypothetical protein [Gammaproteobacteria bacterium]